MSSRRNPLHLSSCYCYGYRFWEVLWKSAYSRSNMKPKSSNIHSKTGSEIDRGIVLLVSGASAQCSFHFAFICMHLSSCSFHVHASSFRFAFISFHVPFIFLPFPFICIHVISFSFHFLSCSFQCACISFHLPSICMHAPFILHYFPFISFMSFHFLSKVMELARLWLGQGTKCNKWLSLSCR